MYNNLLIVISTIGLAISLFILIHFIYKKLIRGYVGGKAIYVLLIFIPLLMFNFIFSAYNADGTEVIDFNFWQIFLNAFSNSITCFVSPIDIDIYKAFAECSFYSRYFLISYQITSLIAKLTLILSVIFALVKQTLLKCKISSNHLIVVKRRF